MNRTDRLLAMVMHLQGRRVVRAEELAQHFEISVRTVYRDVVALSEAGVPVVGEAGVGYSLVKGYHLPPVMFTRDEAIALFVGGEMVKQFTDASMATPMQAALLKLRAVLPREQQDDVDRLARATAIAGRSGRTGTPDRQTLLPIQQALVARRVLRLVYRVPKRDQSTVREAEPMGILFYQGSWYLVAWCLLRADYRHFRLDRIEQLEITSRVFTPRPGFSLEKHLATMRLPEDMAPVKVWFARGVLERVRRESMVEVVEGAERDGGVECRLNTSCLTWFARWLLSFGLDAEALEPAELRERIATEAAEIAARHQTRVAETAGTWRDS